MTTALRTRLRVELTARMRQRDRVAVATLRTALAALDNAEAVPVTPLPRTGDGPVAQAVLGVGAAEVERRALSEVDEVALVRAELASLDESVAELEALGRDDRAATAREQAHVLRAVLGDAAGPRVDQD